MVRNLSEQKSLSLLNQKGSSAILFAVAISMIAVGVHLGLGLYISMTARNARAQAEKRSIETNQNNSLTIASKLMGTGLIEYKDGTWVSNISKSPNSVAFAWNFSAGDGEVESGSPSPDLASIVPFPKVKGGDDDDGDDDNKSDKKGDSDDKSDKDDDDKYSLKNPKGRGFGILGAYGVKKSDDEAKPDTKVKTDKPKTDKKSGKATKPPKISMQFCDSSRFSASDRNQIFGTGTLPSQCLVSNSQVEISNPLANGKADVTLTTFASSDTAGTEEPLSTLRARVGTTSSGSRPTPNNCQAVTNIASLNILYQTILGRDMNASESIALSDCISQGRLFPDHLEGSETGLCGGITPLRLTAEYSKQMEVINSLYQLFLDRLPSTEDAALIPTYRTTLGANDKISGESVKKLIAKIKKDHKLTASSPLKLTAMQKYYDLMYGGSKKLTPSLPVVKDLAKGEITFSKLRQYEFAGSSYRNRGKIEGERVSFLYMALMNKWPSAAVHASYLKLMSYGKTDPILQPFEWLAQDFRSSEEYASSGGCAMAPPPAQIFVKVVSSSLASWAGYQVSENRCVPNGGAIKDSTEPVKNVCPSGTKKRKVMLPSPVNKASFKKTAVAFGNLSEARFEGTVKSFDPLVKSVHTFPDIKVNSVANGVAVTASGSVSGPSGGNTNSDSVTAEVRTPITVINKLSNVYGLGPDTVYKTDSENTKNLVVHDVFYPAPALFLTTSNLDIVKENFKVGSAGEVEVTQADIDKSVTYHRHFYWGWSHHPELKSNFIDSFPGAKKASGKTPPSDVIPSATSATDYTLKVNEFNYMLRDSGANWGSEWVQHFSSDYSPLVIDLTNEGVKLSSPNEGVLFDLEGRGVKSRYSWVENTKSVAFIAYDKNHNGRIDDVHELFGDNTQGPDAKTAENGFESLIKYDSNHDASIDTQDGIFDSLLLWSDLNRNGISEPNELSPLALSGVKSLDLKYEGVTEVNDRHGNLTHGRSVAVMHDDSLRTVHDVWFVEGNISRKSTSFASR